MSIIAVIPARGKSKGIPRKNLQNLAGHPLLAWSITAAKEAGCIDRVVVSTDDALIAETALCYGAEVVKRPDAISGDADVSETALLHVLDYFLEKETWEPDLVVFLQATSPLRRAEDIQASIEVLKKTGADSLFSACHVEGFTWRAAVDNVNNLESPNIDVQPVNYDPAHRPRRQDLKEEILEENGSIYVFKPWVLRQYNSRLGGEIAVYRMDRLGSFQVDELSDLELLEKLISWRNEFVPPKLIKPKG